MNYMTIKFPDIANGPGTRASLFVSGCPHHCKGCFNKKAWDYDAGHFFDFNSLEFLLKILNDESKCHGFTILGGEPLCPNNVETVIAILDQILLHVTNKKVLDNIWIYTGYTMDELEEMINIKRLQRVSVIVDGPFIEEKRDITLTYCGSSNQRLIDVKKYLNGDKDFELDKYHYGKYQN